MTFFITNQYYPIFWKRSIITLNAEFEDTMIFKIDDIYRITNLPAIKLVSLIA
ncbi:MAG: hypothetical protein WKF91_06870 [Segetibacter sp.]